VYQIKYPRLTLFTFKTIIFFGCLIAGLQQIKIVIEMEWFGGMSGG